MFWKRKQKPAEYTETPAFTDPVAQAAFGGASLPLTSFRSGTGQPVFGSLDAFQPAVFKPSNAQVFTTPYGRGFMPNDLVVQQPLARGRTNAGNI